LLGGRLCAGTWGFGKLHKDPGSKRNIIYYIELVLSQLVDGRQKVLGGITKVMKMRNFVTINLLERSLLDECGYTL